MSENIVVILTVIYIIITTILCTYMIKDTLRMRKERKEMEKRRGL